MRSANTLVLNSKLPMEQQITILQKQIDKLYYMLQGRVALGTGTDGVNGMNISGQFQQFTTSATPDAENTIPHTVGSVPLGYEILWQDKAGSLYQSPTNGTDWTSTDIYLKCSVASVTFLVFLHKKGTTN